MVEAIEDDDFLDAGSILDEGLDPDSIILTSKDKESLLHYAADSDSPQCAKAREILFGRVPIKANHSRYGFTLDKNIVLLFRMYLSWIAISVFSIKAKMKFCF